MLGSNRNVNIPQNKKLNSIHTGISLKHCNTNIVIMKPLTGMEEMVLVHPGEDWPYPQNPCTREMMRILERNERFVSWLQPKTKGVADQIPAICVKVFLYALTRITVF